MPLPGGPADKFGNRYELAWTVYQFVSMLHGKADSIRIEQPGLTKAEFVMSLGGNEELHQAKRSSPEGKWSLSSLASPEIMILQSIYAELAGNNKRFVFVSSSDAPELRELSERARDAQSLNEFESYFLSSGKQSSYFNNLKKHWNCTSTATVYELLKRIIIQINDERSIEELIQWGIQVLFFYDPTPIIEKLRSIAIDSIHRTITREELAAQLAKDGFQLRRQIRPEQSKALIIAATDDYVSGIRKKLICKKLLPREATKTLLQRVSERTSSDSVITGKAGAGKSGCILEFVEALRERGIPVLALRLDRLKPVSTSAELGQQLGFEESPPIVLAGVAPSSPAVLVIDQLDIVSTTSGRNTDFLDAVESTLAEVRGIRQRADMHIVIVCRKFDWENDHRLRGILSQNITPIEVSEFSKDEVSSVLTSENFDINNFQPQQLNLLRLPQNLALFLDSGFAPGGSAAFKTVKELYDRYWNTKREAVRRRSTPQVDQWLDVINAICEEMHRSQQLFVSRERLDFFSPLYLAQLASEGVLAFSENRYSFGHESFFDYCIARSFVGTGKSLKVWLAQTEQSLFRRAQLRQILTYLREADKDRYCAELKHLLRDSNIRTHLKDLALALLVNVPDPDNYEWDIIAPWLNQKISAIKAGQPNQDKFASLVWNHFFASHSWFHLADKCGVIPKWLAFSEDDIIDNIISYLRIHIGHSSSRIAEILDVRLEYSGKWINRLRYIMQWVDLGHSRRFFELFLKVLDNGVLDVMPGSGVEKSIFWQMTYNLSKKQPEWLIEAISHWLKRRVAVVRGQKDKDGNIPWNELFSRESAFGELRQIAKQAPSVFAKKILPLLLEIADAAADNTEKSPPRLDRVWFYPTLSNYESMDDVFLNSTIEALVYLSKEEPHALDETIYELSQYDTYISNFILLKIYIANPPRFANDAAERISMETWRFECGYSGSSYWISSQLIRTIMPICSYENRIALEKSIINYFPINERTGRGFKIAGSACYYLLSAIPFDLRSPSAHARFKVLEIKFKHIKTDAAPRCHEAYFIVSPINTNAAKKMTDKQWLKAITKYHSDERFSRWDAPEKGGARELAGELLDCARKEPERFANLSFRFGKESHPAYMRAVLNGLKTVPALWTLKLDVCRRAFSDSREEWGTEIADLLGSFEEMLSDEGIQILHWLATQHPDPTEDRWNQEPAAQESSDGQRMLTEGLNTTRGRATRAVHDLIIRNSEYLPVFRPTLTCLVMDQSVAVRSWVASILLTIARTDMELALQYFHVLAVADERLLATEYAGRFIYYGIYRHFSEIRVYIERMLRSPAASVNRVGASLASLSGLSHPSAADMVEAALRGTDSHRLGVADVAAQNLSNTDCRSWCETRLIQFFKDSDVKVRYEAASCFRELENQPLESYEDLINAFCDSPAFLEAPSPLLQVLTKSLQRLPGITAAVGKKFLSKLSEEADDIRARRASDADMVVELIFRTYQQHSRDEWANQCLDLIDRMCLERLYQAKEALDKFER